MSDCGDVQQGKREKLVVHDTKCTKKKIGKMGGKR